MAIGYLVTLPIGEVAQAPNNQDNQTVGLQNLDNQYTIDVSDNENFEEQTTYTLAAGQWYTYTGPYPIFYRVTPGQPTNSIKVWVNPGGSANIGNVPVTNTGNATQLQGVDISSNKPTDGQGLFFDSTKGLWLPATIVGGTGINVSYSDATDELTISANPTLSYLQSWLSSQTSVPNTGWVGLVSITPSIGTWLLIGQLTASVNNGLFFEAALYTQGGTQLSLGNAGPEASNAPWQTVTLVTIVTLNSATQINLMISVNAGSTVQASNSTGIIGIKIQ